MAIIIAAVLNVIATIVSRVMNRENRRLLFIESLFAICRALPKKDIIFTNTKVMMIMRKNLSVLTFALLLFSLVSNHFVYAQPISVGAEQVDEYLPYIKDKKVALVVNQTSMVKNTHLVDTLKSLKVNIKTIFAPEHGFRGTADAGEHVKNDIDMKTGIPLISLYGSNKKPTPSQLKNIDAIIFDIQDVGARFYTYISTMHYVMEAAAENNIKVIILDRPNPNGYYVAGPVLDTSAIKSFVGMHPVPVVHGMTVGEYAQMLNGEGWLAKGVKCDLTIIPCKGYTHNSIYAPPVKPSPNLPNLRAIYLYPTLCLFEGTVISVGRGTDAPFQITGNPYLEGFSFSFIPKSTPGAKSPLWEGKTCYGIDYSSYPEEDFRHIGFDISFLIEYYKKYKGNEPFFNDFFKNLAGNTRLQHQIEEGMPYYEIKATWQNNINEFKVVRKKYLLYTDFE